MRRPGVRALTVLALLIVLAVGIGLMITGSRSQEPSAAPLPSRQFSVAAGRLPALTLPSLAASQPAAGPSCSYRVGASRVVVPSLCLDGPIVPTVVQPGGALAIPQDVHQIGQWSAGAALLGPGGRAVRHGTTLMAGHVNYIGQGNGTFYDLAKIAPGAVVYASDPAGHVTRWRVTALAVVIKAKLPSWVFAGRTGPRRLVLVTCGGPIEHIAGYGNTYRDNVIATAVPG